MSKAILIIDVDDNADFENAIADITFRENEWGLAPRGIKRWHNGIKAKPLPEKKSMFGGSSYDIIENRGYNICLDEILWLGEE